MHTSTAFSVSPAPAAPPPPAPPNQPRKPVEPVLPAMWMPDIATFEYGRRWRRAHPERAIPVQLVLFS